MQIRRIRITEVKDITQSPSKNIKSKVAILRNYVNGLIAHQINTIIWTKYGYLRFPPGKKAGVRQIWRGVCCSTQENRFCLRHKKNIQKQLGLKNDDATHKIDKNPIVSQPSQHSPSLYFLRRLKIDLFSSGDMLFRWTLQFPEEKQKNIRGTDQSDCTADLSSTWLHALMLNYSQRSKTWKYHLSQCTHINIQGLVKICDFGWSISSKSMRQTFCGTPLYVSPELLKRKSYNNKIDVWGLGILAYELLFGRVPFDIVS